MARKKELEEQQNTEVEEVDPAEARVYELGFHIEPELSQDEVKKVYQGIRSVIETNGTIITEGQPEKIPLAYTMSLSDNAGRHDYDSANFSWIAFEAQTAGHEVVIEAAKAEKRIIRFLDLRTTKEEAHHSAEMREIREKLPEPSDAEDAVSDVELDAALESAVV
jgi:ribosomal protein S6